VPACLTAETLRDLAPVFSDRPKWAGAHEPGLEYRRSPVLATTKTGCVYLNLDLTDYFRWRLHPDQPRAAAVRSVMAGVAFSARLSEGLIDWTKTQLPLGTQVVWLQVRGAPASGPRILALRRNPQSRLHELGGESDGNWPFEKAEPFVLAFRAPVSVEPLAPQPSSLKPQASSLLQGTLDPITPVLFQVAPAAPEPPKLVIPASARIGETLEIKVARPEAENAKSGGVISVRVFAPDGTERRYHAATAYAADGTLNHTVPLALNEPAGTWKIVARDLTNGGMAAANLSVLPAANSQELRAKSQ
jgi:hypothetical protein